jgi:GNAT superfamily N-acetyltransferase
VAGITIRPFQEPDLAAVRAPFIRVNRELAPPDRRDIFEAYIARSLTEEIDRIGEYYRERRGEFYVALRETSLVGMFGLEQASAAAMELRRMYVDPAARRGGLGRSMLRIAEAECLRRGARLLELSTS